jgi:hypothetical protein
VQLIALRRRYLSTSFDRLNGALLLTAETDDAPVIVAQLMRRTTALFAHDPMLDQRLGAIDWEITSVDKGEAMTEEDKARLAHDEFTAAYNSYHSIWTLVRPKARALAELRYNAALEAVVVADEALDAKRRVGDPVYAAQSDNKKEQAKELTDLFATLKAMEHDGLIQLNGIEIVKYLKPDDPRVKAWRGQSVLN